MFTYGQVTVIDDFIDLDYQEKIKKELMGGFDKHKKHHTSQFPWFYIEDVTAAGDDDSQHRPAMSHQYVELDERGPTLGGYIVHNTQEIPKKGEILIIKSLKFEVKEVTETKIETLSLNIRN